MNIFFVLFADVMIAAAKSSEVKAPFNNNLPSQTKGVMVNPVNPDSNN
jgi:ribosomal protein L35AE/L33A